MTARTIALTPHAAGDIGAWYGHGIGPAVEDVGAGGEFQLDDGAVLEDVFVVWRYNGPDSGRPAEITARLEQRWGRGGRKLIADLGRPYTITGLARAVSRWLNRPEALRVLRADSITVARPDALPFPGSY